MLYLATTNRVIQSKELSDKLGIPQSIVLKIGKILKDNDMVNITTGLNGGFLLQKQPKDINMYDIISLFEPTIKINRCLEEDGCCSRFAAENCPVRKFYCKVQKRFEDSLKNTTIAEFI